MHCNPGGKAMSISVAADSAAPLEQNSTMHNQLRCRMNRATSLARAEKAMPRHLQWRGNAQRPRRRNSSQQQLNTRETGWALPAKQCCTAATQCEATSSRKMARVNFTRKPGRRAAAGTCRLSKVPTSLRGWSSDQVSSIRHVQSVPLLSTLSPSSVL